MNKSNKRPYLLIIPAREPTQEDVTKMCAIFPTWHDDMACWSEYKFGRYKTVTNALRRLIKHRTDNETKDTYLSYRVEVKCAQIIDTRTGKNVLTTKRRV